MQPALVHNSHHGNNHAANSLALNGLASNSRTSNSLASNSLAGNSFASNSLGAAGKAAIPTYNGRPDYDFAAALDKVSPQIKTKALTQAQNFEATFINSMFSQMTNGLKGEGPFGSTVGTGIWRSMQIEQYSKSFAKAGGIGVAKNVYRTLIMHEAKTTRAIQEKQA
jgi:peptidoglycan hydrolase FlgJ